MSLHRQRVHPEYVEGCFGCRAGSIQFATAPTNEAQAKQYRFQNKFFAEFSNGDREAYKRLRANGEQPPTIAGSAHLEKHAATSFEISSGQIAADQKGLKAALAQCADSNIDPAKPHTTPKAG